MSNLSRRDQFIIGALPAAERLYAEMGPDSVRSLIGNGVRDKSAPKHQAKVIAAMAICIGDALIRTLNPGAPCKYCGELVMRGDDGAQESFDGESFICAKCGVVPRKGGDVEIPDFPKTSGF